MTSDEIEKIYEQVKPKLRAMASKYVGWHDAEDIVQDAFVRALCFPGVFRRQAAVATWLTRILLNTAIDETRRRKRRPSCVTDSQAIVGGHAVMPAHLEVLDVKAALAAGNRMDREVLVLAGLFGLSSEETARRLGVTAGTAKSRLWHARRRLRHRLSHAITAQSGSCHPSPSSIPFERSSRRAQVVDP
jgi:RNA polymerase sigma factor (sigma-70 family)